MSGLSVSFTTGCAIDKDLYYIACSPDQWREEEETPYTAIYIYQDPTKEKWFYHLLPNWEVSSVCFPKPDPNDVRKVYALSVEGEIECYSRNGSIVEKIADAGLNEKDANKKPIYGAVTAIREIDNMLYVCGLGGQVYKRTTNGWEHFDDGLLQPLQYNKPDIEVSADMTYEEIAAYAQAMSDAFVDGSSLYDINGSSGNDIYVVGLQGFIAHYNGYKWTILQPETEGSLPLNAIHIVSKQEVWIVGGEGAVLRGNAKDGFKLLFSDELATDFYAIAYFNNEIYISGEDGIYIFKNGKPERQKISDTADLTGVSNIEAKDGVLWALSDKKLLRLSGSKWEIFEHPNNMR